MSDVAPPLDAPVESAPPPEAVAPVAEPAAPPAPPLDEEAAIDAALEKDAITINHSGDKLVPLAAVETVRGQNKELKKQLKELVSAQEKADALQAKLNEVAPLADAFRAVAAAQSLQQQQPPQAVAPQDDPEALEFAKNADLWDAEGKPDVAKAQKLLGLIDRRAEQKAQTAAAPLVQENLQQRALHLLERAKVTPINGELVDPGILTAMFQQVASQPGGLQSLADPRNVAIMTKLAHTETMIKRGPKAAAATPPPAPLFTEPAGGKASALPALNAGDRKVARELGITDTEYAKRLQDMPWRK